MGLFLLIHIYIFFSCVWDGKWGVSLCHLEQKICHVEQKIQGQIPPFWFRQIPEALHFSTDHSDKALVTFLHPKSRLIQQLNLKGPLVCDEYSLSFLNDSSSSPAKGFFSFKMYQVREPPCYSWLSVPHWLGNIQKYLRAHIFILSHPRLSLMLRMFLLHHRLFNYIALL